jgi:hypothetical protein
MSFIAWFKNFLSLDLSIPLKLVDFFVNFTYLPIHILNQIAQYINFIYIHFHFSCFFGIHIMFDVALQAPFWAIVRDFRIELALQRDCLLLN